MSKVTSWDNKSNSAGTGTTVATTMYFGTTDINRSGNTVTLGYDVCIAMWGQQNSNRWAVKVKINGTQVKNNGTVKSYSNNWADYPTGEYFLSAGSPASKGNDESNVNVQNDAIRTSFNVTGNPTSVPYEVRFIDTGWDAGWTNFQAQEAVLTGNINLSSVQVTAPSISGSLGSKVSASRGGSNGSAKLTISKTSGNYASIESSSCTFGGHEVEGNPAVFSGLRNNTIYSWELSIKNTAGLTDSDSGSFYLDPVAPTNPSKGNISFSRNGSTYNVTIPLSSSYDTNRKFSSYTMNYGTSTSYGSTKTSSSSSGVTLTGLQPHKTYYYRVYTTDQNNDGATNSNLSSGYTTGSFTTPCNKPGNLNITRTSSNTTSISVSVSGNGDTNAPITDYTVWWRKKGTSSSHNHSIGTATTYTITGLEVDTNYDLAVVATNAGGTTDSGWIKVNSTTLTNPTLTNPNVTNLKPFTCTISANGSITPNRTLQYRFSKNDGNNWTAYQSSNTYNWSGLSEETHYKLGVQVKATHTGNDAQDTSATKYVDITTPADQAKIRIKKNGNWEQGKLYFKKDGVWVKAKKVYIKKNGQWIINKNN